MTDERRQQVEEIVMSLLPLGTSERAARLDLVCINDLELRHEAPIWHERTIPVWLALTRPRCRTSSARSRVRFPNRFRASAWASRGRTTAPEMFEFVPASSRPLFDNLVWAPHFPTWPTK